MYLEEWCGASGMKLLSICFASFTMSPNSAITVAIRSSGVCWNVDDVCCKVSTIPWRSCVVACILLTFVCEAFDCWSRVVVTIPCI